MMAPQQIWRPDYPHMLRPFHHNGDEVENALFID
jgi:hypothetical protein